MTIAWYLLIVGSHLFSIVLGIVLHTRWIDRRLTPKPQPKQVTQQGQGNGVTQ